MRKVDQAFAQEEENGNQPIVRASFGAILLGLVMILLGITPMFGGGLIIIGFGGLLVAVATR